MITHQKKVSIYNFISSSRCSLLPVAYNSNWARVSCAPMALVVISTLISTRIPAFYSAGRKKRQFCSSSRSPSLGSHVRGALPAASMAAKRGEDEEKPPHPGGLCLPSRDPAPASPRPSSASAELQPISQLHHRKHLKQPQKGAWGVLSEPWRQQGNGTWAHWTANYASKMCWLSSDELEFWTETGEEKKGETPSEKRTYSTGSQLATPETGKGKRRATETRRELTHRSPSSSQPPPDPNEQKLNKAQNLLQMTSLN